MYKFIFVLACAICLQIVGYIALKKNLYEEGFLFLSASIIMTNLGVATLIIYKIKLLLSENVLTEPVLPKNSSVKIEK